MDGYTSLFCFYYANLLTSDVRILGDVPSTHHIPEGVKDKNVVIVDTAYNKEIVKGIVNLSKSVLFIDHHKTIIDDIKLIKSDKLTIIYDKNKSGASLSWIYCFNSPLPKFIKLIEDNDIGEWKYNETKAFMLGIGINFDISSPKISSLKQFKKLLDESYVNSLIKESEPMLIYKNYLIKKSLKNYAIKKFEGYKIAVLNSASPLTPDIGTELSKLPGIDFSLLWSYSHNRKLYFVSLKSQNIDVGSIAKKYGGGGHTYASSFTTTKFIDSLFN
jgi:nanoRNase/pAp phosphatase (c-di-AMP/oligoRNAs hydrolase)